ncbi:MAG: hypothetical protein ACIRZ1_09285, partial [Ligilactobacillus ruminis]
INPPFLLNPFSFPFLGFKNPFQFRFLLKRALMILLCPLSGCKRHLTETIGFFRDATGFKKASFGFEKIF